jgi:RNase P protein component
MYGTMNAISIKFEDVFRFRDNFREMLSFSWDFCKNRNFRKMNFREVSWKLAHFRIIFAFSQKLKNAFSLQT